MERDDHRRLEKLEAALRDLAARLSAFHPTAEGFVLGSTRLFEKLVTDEYHFYQRNSDGTESDLTGARSLQGVPVSETAPTSGYVLAYNSATGEWEPTVSSSPAAHVLATTAGLGASHTTSGLTVGQYLRATAAAAAAFQAIPGADVPASHSGSTHAATQAAAEATAAAALATHVAAGDPHTGYQKESERDAANGYCPLDASADVPLANLPASVIQRRIVYVLDGSSASTTVPQAGSPVLPACSITNIEVKLDEDKTCGATSLIIDVHKIASANKNTDGTGTTIYTTQANRPTISNGNRYTDAAQPDVTSVAAGDVLVVYVDQAGTGVTKITVTITVDVT
jgi:hypothetical protein